MWLLLLRREAKRENAKGWISNPEGTRTAQVVEYLVMLLEFLFISLFSLGGKLTYKTNIRLSLLFKDCRQGCLEAWSSLGVYQREFQWKKNHIAIAILIGILKFVFWIIIQLPHCTISFPSPNHSMHHYQRSLLNSKPFSLTFLLHTNTWVHRCSIHGYMLCTCMFSVLITWRVFPGEDSPAVGIP